MNYKETIAPATEAYIAQSVSQAAEADGSVTSWDLNATADRYIDCLLDAINC